MESFKKFIILFLFDLEVFLDLNKNRGKWISRNKIGEKSSIFPYNRVELELLNSRKGEYDSSFSFKK